MPRLKLAQDLLDILYPVGSVYISTNSTDPSNLFGGQWTQITGRFLYCTNTSKTTGGSDTTGSHVLTKDEIPSHNHGVTVKAHWGGAGNTSAENYNIGTKTDTNWGNRSWMNYSDNTGGGKGHTHPQNLPPYFTVYCWYRTS